MHIRISSRYLLHVAILPEIQFGVSMPLLAGTSAACPSTASERDGFLGIGGDACLVVLTDAGLQHHFLEVRDDVGAVRAGAANLSFLDGVRIDAVSRQDGGVFQGDV